MSDIHRLPLLGHDMPYYLVTHDAPPPRARVFSRRSATGHLHWYFRTNQSPILHGPYLSPEDAHDDAEKTVHAYT